MSDLKKTKIGLMHFRVGETDGVSLEMEKWKIVLEQMGYEVVYIAGSGGSIKDYIEIKGLHYKNPSNELLVEAIYKHKDKGMTEEEIRNLLEKYTSEIRNELTKAINEHHIDYLIPNNILSLGWNVAAGLATIQSIEDTDVKVICHHHDFHWERALYSNPKFSWVKVLLNKYFPPRNPSIKHVVINRIAQKELRKIGLESIVIPNVFDFEHHNWGNDGYISNLKNDLDIKQNEIIFLQGTRIVQRKGIELMIEYISKFNKSLKKCTSQKLYDGRTITNKMEGILLLVGQNEDPTYYDKLYKFAETKKVKMKDVSHCFSHVRREVEGKKTYSFWDAYSLGDIVSYPSLLEGFGNQFLEAIYGKKPVIVYEYPVYKEDLHAYDFQIVSLGSTYRMVNGLAEIPSQIMDYAVDEGVSLLTNRDKYNQMVSTNYDICLRYFSYSSLKHLLGKLYKEEKIYD